MNIANIGAALGGASQGVDQGMNLYAKYEELADQNKKRQDQRTMEAKISELAKSGKFKTDPIGATREIASGWQELGRQDMYEQYTKSANETQKALGSKQALLATSSSMVSPDDTVTHLNDFSATMGLGTKFQKVMNPKGGFTVLGMGTDPKVGQTFADNKSFSDAVHSYLAPMVLDPKDAFAYDREQAKGAADVRQADSASRQNDAQTGEIQTLLPGKVGLQGAQTAATYASGRASDASAANAYSEIGDRKATLDVRKGVAQSTIEANRAQAKASEEATSEAHAMAPFKVAGAMADVSAKAQDLANKPRNDALAREKVKSGIRADDSLIDYRERGGAAKEESGKAILESYVPQDIESLKHPENVPLANRAEELTPLASYIRGDTKSDNRLAYAMANEILQNITTLQVSASHPDTVRTPNGRTYKLGVNGVRWLQQRTARLKAEQAARK